MKFLHISDLHLGRKFYGLTFLPQQEKMLTQIVQLVQEEHISGVLLAGDIYDKPIPPADAVTLFDAFLTELAQLQVQVFLISGNHDSPERLQFGSRLLEENHIHIAGVFRGELPCVTVSDACGPLHIYLMPFVKFHEAASFFKEQKPEDFSELLGQLIQQTPICPAERNLLLYHGFVTDATFAPECSDSEWQLGGMQNVDPAVFAPFDYVALGTFTNRSGCRKARFAIAVDFEVLVLGEPAEEVGDHLGIWGERQASGDRAGTPCADGSAHTARPAGGAAALCRAVRGLDSGGADG